MTRELSATIVKSLAAFAIAFMVVFGVLLMVGGFKPGPALAPGRHFPAAEQENIFTTVDQLFTQKNAYTAGMLGPSNPIRAGLGINGWVWVGTFPLNAISAVTNYLVNATGFAITTPCILLFENIARPSYPQGFDPVKGSWGNTESNNVVTRLGVYHETTESSWILFDATSFNNAVLADYPTLNVYYLRA